MFYEVYKVKYITDALCVFNKLFEEKGHVSENSKEVIERAGLAGHVPLSILQMELEARGRGQSICFHRPANIVSWKPNKQNLNIFTLILPLKRGVKTVPLICS